KSGRECGYAKRRDFARIEVDTRLSTMVHKIERNAVNRTAANIKIYIDAGNGLARHHKGLYRGRDFRNGVKGCNRFVQLTRCKLIGSNGPRKSAGDLAMFHP